ncbi:hypothetical protein ACSYHE_12495, partial [Geobacillus thermodenitrificans subsp. calidus]
PFQRYPIYLTLHKILDGTLFRFLGLYENYSRSVSSINDLEFAIIHIDIWPLDRKKAACQWVHPYWQTPH